jgi:hypothetical protein
LHRAALLQTVDQAPGRLAAVAVDQQHLDAPLAGELEDVVLHQRHHQHQHQRHEKEQGQTTAISGEEQQFLMQGGEKSAHAVSPADGGR